MTNELRANGARLWQSLMAMAEIGATPAGGCNRQAMTDLDAKARRLFIKWAEEVGCTTRIDQIGNIFVRREGRDPTLAPVMSGSHLDTQATGGRFDGVYGVMAALEMLRVLHENDVETDHPVEVAVWTNEEGCRFAPAMLGSGVVSGIYDLDFAYAVTDKNGVSLGEELDTYGFRGDFPAKPRPFRAVFEAHIEQGPILEAEHKVIGAVTGIQGAVWLDVTLTGAACHAGPTPMHMRRDPWFGATAIIDGAYALAEKYGEWARVTIGDVKALPGSRNTVPESLTITFDLRHPEKDTLDALEAEFRALVAAKAKGANLEFAIDEVWVMPPTPFDRELVDLVESSALAMDLPTQRIVSGAGHDSLHTAQFAPTAMIFVPCAGGLSHNEAESAEPEHLKAGADVLVQAVLGVAITNSNHQTKDVK